MNEQKLKDTISARFKELRKKYKLSQHKFAEEIGVSASSISSYEAKGNLPPVLILAKISEKYSVPIDWLCGKDTKDDHLITVADLVQIYEEAKEKLGIECIQLPIENVPDFLGDCSIGIFMSNPITEEKVYKIIKDIDTMYNLYKKETISADIYNQWKSERMNVYKEASISTLRYSTEYDSNKNSFDIFQNYYQQGINNQPSAEEQQEE